MVKEFGVHECTKDDWGLFYDPAEKNKARFNDLKKNKKMFCIDQLDKRNRPIDFRLFGLDVHAPHRSIEIVYRASTKCPPSKRKSRRNRRCTMTKKNLRKVKQWLGAPEFTILYNIEKINFQYFDERKINKEVVITNYQWSPTVPITLQSRLHKHILNDNIQFLQIGIPHVSNYL